MQMFNNLTIKWRMTFSFVLIVFFFTIFGYLTLRQMNILSDLTNTLYTHPLQVSNASLDAKAGLISMHRHMKDVSTAKSELAISIAIKKVQDEEAEVYAQLSLVKEFILGEEGKKLIEEATELFAGWKPIRVEVQELVMQGKLDVANRITREKGADYVARLERKMEELTRYARNKADGFMLDATETQERIFRTFLLFTVIFIGLAVCIGILISLSILQSIDRLQKAMRRITKTGELQEALLDGNNEITQMSEHFNVLIVKLREQFWLKESTNSLNEALSGNQSYAEILQNSIEQICRNVNGCSGAIYSFDQENGQCDLMAKYAFSDGQEFTGSFPLGNGVVGQVASDRQAIFLDNLQGSRLRFESGSSSTRVDNLAALPLLHDNQLQGVLEVAFLDKTASITRQYLESAVAILSTALNTARQGSQIKSLLTEAQGSNIKLQSQTEELQLQTQELQVLNVEIQQQSEELKSQNLELEFQRRQVEEANRLKSEFLSNMSHELRTPLNSVNALSRVLIVQAGEKLTEEEQHYLEIIERNGKQLLALINDILDLSKIEAGRMDIQLSSFSVAKLLENILENIAPLANQKQLRVDYAGADSLLHIESDEKSVHKILENIIANAVKFTEKGGISITTSRHYDQVRIAVRDTGIGISAGDLETIFDEFRQVDGATSRKFEGTGLGLSIAYKAVKLLGGDIRVASKIGKGTEFSIVLPIEYRGPAREGAVLDQVVTPQGSAAAQCVRPNTILIVDDDPEVLSELSSLFEKEGYGTITASSGKQALELAESKRPLAITLDIVMPGMDGWEVLAKLKEDPVTAAIPVIITSMTDEQATGFALGAIGYVTKPVNSTDLLYEINRASKFLPSQILVVDDDDLDRQLTSQAIVQAGMKVLLSDSGLHCLELLEQTNPDLVIVDLVMPLMDGFELVDKLRSKPETAQLPVIVLTAKELTPGEKARLETSVSSIVAKGDKTTERLLGDIDKVLRMVPKQVLRRPVATADQKPRILVVEDNEVAVIQVKKALEAQEIHVDVASDGTEALEYIQTSMPQGVILDLMMPNTDGFQTLEKLRMEEETRELPVLILTAKDLTQQEINRLFSNNVQQLIQKGDVDRSELLEKVLAMLDRPVTAHGDGEAAGQISQLPVSAEPEQKPGPSLTAGWRRDQGNDPLILAIEDNRDNMTTIRAILPSELKIEEAYDGREGLRKTLELHPDLVLLDMALPEMDGMEVVKFLKNNAKTSSIPVIAFTAQAMKGDKERILKAGCDDYIAKPMSPEALRNKVGYWLGLTGEPKI